MAEIVIFGIQDLAELADYYLEHDSGHTVAAFAVHRAYMQGDTFRGKPVVAMEDLEATYPPDRVKLFAPMTQRKMNKLRADVYNEGKEKGYDFISYVSSKATVCHNEIGENCFILEDNTLQPFTRIGNNVVMWSGNHIGHHGIIGDHVFFTSHVIMSGHCTIEPYCFFGVNAAIRDQSHIAEGTLLAMGATLVHNTTDPYGIYIGNPAKKREGKRSDEVM